MTWGREASSFRVHSERCPLLSILWLALGPVAHSPSRGSPSVPWLALRPVARPSSRPGVTACLHFYRSHSLGKTAPSAPPPPQPEAVLGVWTPAGPWGLGCARAVMFCDLSSCINQTGLTQRCVFFPPFHSRSPVNILEKKMVLEIYFSKHLKRNPFT